MLSLLTVLLSPPNVNVVNIGEDYEIGRSVRRCVSVSIVPCVRLCTRL